MALTYSGKRNARGDQIADEDVEWWRGTDAIQARRSGGSSRGGGSGSSWGAAPSAKTPAPTTEGGEALAGLAVLGGLALVLFATRKRKRKRKGRR